MATANEKFKGKYTKTKTLNKEYSVNRNAALQVSNSYGNIEVTRYGISTGHMIFSEEHITARVYIIIIQLFVIYFPLFELVKYFNQPV